MTPIDGIDAPSPSCPPTTHGADDAKLLLDMLGLT